MANYTYLLAVLLLISLWIIFFLSRKDLQRVMLTISIIVLFFGLFLQYFFWTKDWWHPKTITGTILGIEDFLGLFGIGGIASVIYKVLFRKRLYYKNPYRPAHLYAILFIFFLAFHIFLFFAVELHSSIIWLITTSVLIVFIYLKRPDLITNSLTSGILMVLLGIIGYKIIDLYQLGFLYDWFRFDKLSGIVIFGVILEDILWFMTFGMLIGPLYEFLQGAKLK